MEARDFIEALLLRGQKSLLETINGLSQQEMTLRTGSDANPIGFILWHIIRTEDRNFQTTMQNKPQIWDTGKWGEKLGMSASAKEFGFGYTTEQIANFPSLSLELLLDYAQIVRNSTVEYVRTISSQDLERRIQHPAFGDLSLGQLIARVLNHISEHTGQIGFIRGLVKDASK